MKTELLNKDSKVVFMGTPDFGVPSLNMLIEEGYNIVGCITQPDRKAGRGHKLTFPPTKICAQNHCIPVYQFEKISSEEGERFLEELAPDLLITAAFGHILSEKILSIPKYGCINVHASLLPKYRGAAPIRWAILNGEKQTGITTMYTVKALDAGDILEQDAIQITPEMTGGELYNELSNLGAHTLKRTLQKLADGTLKRIPQDPADASYFPMFTKNFWEIDFNKRNSDILNFIRAGNPVPGAYMMYNDEPIKVYNASIISSNTSDKPGEVLAADGKNGLQVSTADGVLSLDVIKRRGAKQMDAKDSLRGKKIDIGYRFEKDDII